VACRTHNHTQIIEADSAGRTDASGEQLPSIFVRHLAAADRRLVQLVDRAVIGCWSTTAREQGQRYSPALTGFGLIRIRGPKGAGFGDATVRALKPAGQD